MYLVSIIADTRCKHGTFVHLKAYSDHLKNLKLQKNQNQINQGLKLLHLTFKSHISKSKIFSFTTISKFWSEQKLAQTRTEISAEYKRLSIESSNLDDFKNDHIAMLRALKSSVSFN